MMKVKVTHFNKAEYDAAYGMYPAEADPKDFVRTYSGIVVDKTKDLFGNIYYYIQEDNVGQIHKVPIEECSII